MRSMAHPFTFITTWMNTPHTTSGGNFLSFCGSKENKGNKQISDEKHESVKDFVHTRGPQTKHQLFGIV